MRLIGLAPLQTQQSQQPSEQITNTDCSFRVLARLMVGHSTRVGVQGVKSLGGHFACSCRWFNIYEVKKNLIIILKKKMEILLHFQSFL